MSKYRVEVPREVDVYEVEAGSEEEAREIVKACLNGEADADKLILDHYYADEDETSAWNDSTCWMTWEADGDGEEA